MGSEKGGEGVKRINWERGACVLFVVAGGAALLYVILRFALVLFLPFLLAFALSLCTRPAVRFLARKTGRSKSFWAVSVTLLVLFALGGLSYLLCHRLLLEIQRLLAFLAEDSAQQNGKIASLIGRFREIWGRLPVVSHLQRIELIEQLIGDPAEYLNTQLQQLLSALASRLASGFGLFLRRLPGVALFVLVSVIASFYFAVEYERVRDVLLRILPSRFASRLPAWRRRTFAALKRCLRAYLLLFLLTLIELTLGFWLLRVEYPFLIALLGAALDILPVLGVGTLLVPWAIFTLMTGGTLRGVGLLILYAVMTIIRQIAEPHLVGKSLGLHPLLMLIAFYVGLKLFGFAGIFLGPLLGVLCKAAFELVGEKGREGQAS